MADDTDDDAREDPRDGAADATDDDHDDHDDHDAAPDGEPAEALGGAPDDAEAAIIAAARRRHGSFGAVVAAGMLGFEKLLGRKPREEAPVVVAAPTDPIDIDADGISVPLDEHTSLVAPPLPRTAPKVASSRRRRR
jgi:hypothetical protein